MSVSLETLALAKKYARGLVNQSGGWLHTVYYDTKQNWDMQPDLVSEYGAFYIYSDRSTRTDSEGGTVNVPGIRIGDGVTLLKNLPFITDGGDSTVTVEEKEQWDNKVTAYVSSTDGENLVLSKS